MPTYLEFTNRFCNYCRFSINTIEDSLCIPNDIYDRINSLPLKASKHKCFIYSCYAMLLLTNSFDCKYTIANYKNLDTEQQKILTEKYKFMSYYAKGTDIKNMCVSNAELKTMWGYSSTNVKLDYILKNGGIMDEYGLTEFFMKGYRHINYRADRTQGNYFKIPIDIMLYCTMADDLKDIAFTIYSTICRAVQLQNREKIMLTRDYLKSVTGVDISTISRYIAALDKNNLITVYRQQESDTPKSYPNIYTPIMELDDRHFTDYHSWF